MEVADIADLADTALKRLGQLIAQFDDERTPYRALRRSDFAQLRRTAAPAVPDAVLSRGLAAWSQVLGTINLEMFGHLHNVIRDYDAFFTLQMRSACEYLIRGA